MTRAESRKLLATLAIYTDALEAIALCESTTEDTSRSHMALAVEFDENVQIARQALRRAVEDTG